MPKITITEKDLTSPGMLNVTSNVVYVPGFSTKVPAIFNEKPSPILYDSLNAFQADFGTRIPVLLDKSNNHVYDSGYIYATELLRSGLPVLYDCYPNLKKNNGQSVSTDNGKTYVQNTDNISTSSILTFITNRFNGDAASLNESILKDKGTYNIKFICSGGYVDETDTYGLANLMMSVASDRADCVAIVDHPQSITPTDFIDTGDKLKKVPNNGESNKYGAMFTPWAIYAPPCLANAATDTDLFTQDCNSTTLVLPASFGYLLAYASGVKTNPGWLAMAGAQRGIVPYIQSLCVNLTEAIATKYGNRSHIAINPIVNISPFGLVIWGNRTLYNNQGKGNLTASSFLNIRNLTSDIKKTVWSAARRLTFEQNSDILWVNFKSLITPLLDEMVSGNGLSGYQLKKRVAKQKAELRCVIRLYAIEAVEDFDIEIQLADSTTAILE